MPTKDSLRSRASDQRPGPSLEKQHLWASAPELLEAVKLAYRKHHLGDDTIGWDELSEKLLNALCNAIGDKAFQEWQKPYGRSQPASNAFRTDEPPDDPHGWEDDVY